MDAARSRLVTDHTRLVDSAVRKLSPRLPKHVSRDDLRAAGLLALVLAANSFDPGRGVPFTCYARRRVKGALLDELRLWDWLPRSARKAARETQQPPARRLVSLDALTDSTLPDGDDCATTAVDLVATVQMRAAIKHLRPRLRHVLIRRFYDHWQLTRIGAELGVGEARASQLVTEAVAALRRQMGEAA